MESIWQETAKRPCFGALERDTKTDVLVIGGGMAGLLCAHRLQQEGVDCLLVEAGRICGGVTGSTTAKLTVQHGLIYDKLTKTFGADTARLYYEANRDALDRYRDLCRDLDCDWEEADNFVYARQDRDKLERELAALQRIGAPATLETELPLPFQTVGAVKLPGQAQFHPLKFAFSLAKSLNIREHTKVLELAPHRAKTDRGEITAGTIIVATHFPMLNKHGAFFLKLYQHRSYVLALRNAGGINGMYVDESHTGLSFRPWGGPASAGRRRSPDRQARRRLDGAAHLRQGPLPPGRGGRPLGHPGLHESGRRALYWPLQRRSPGFAGGHGLQQVGHDVLHGRGVHSDGPGAGPEQSLRAGVLPVSLHAASAACRQRRRSPGGPAAPHGAPMSPHGLRIALQPGRAQLGLLLPRLTLHGARTASG